MVRHHHVEEAAGAEGRDREADGGEAQVEALMQVGADEGEGAPEDAAFQRHDQDDGERPAAGCSTRDHLAEHRALRARSPGRAMSGRARMTANSAAPATT